MSKPIMLVGANGNMGRRYSAIFRYFNIPFGGFDVGSEVNWFDQFKVKDWHSIVLVTPTKYHYEHIELAAEAGIPILCEKPITTNKRELELISVMDVPIAMVNQYAWLYDPMSDGESHYNYWNSGKDGQKWDCINIIGLSQKAPLLMNTSPAWTCSINGKDLNIADMDKAYCDMLRDWYRKPEGDIPYILKAHQKVWDGFYGK